MKNKFSICFYFMETSNWSGFVSWTMEFFKNSNIDLSELRQILCKKIGPARVLGGGGKIWKIFLYQKNILFASKKPHSCRNTWIMCVFDPTTRPLGKRCAEFQTRPVERPMGNETALVWESIFLNSSTLQSLSYWILSNNGTCDEH